VIGFDESARILSSGIHDVAQQLEGRLPFSGGWIGLAGFDRPGDRERLVSPIGDLIVNPVFSNDAELLLSGLVGNVGVAVIAGTGSIALGRSKDGTRARAGGWGHIFGDEGSGWALGRDALAAIAAEVDGRGPSTLMTKLVMDAWDLTDPREIVTRAYDPATGKAGIAKLSSLVTRADWEDDAVAHEIIVRETGHLASQVVAVADRLGFDEAIPLAMSGGLLLHVLTYRQALLDAIAAIRPLAETTLVLEPAVQAARSIAAIFHEVNTP
jgi:N-acetylglucosamine kinase-like BadF-type ATPase